MPIPEQLQGFEPYNAHERTVKTSRREQSGASANLRHYIKWLETAGLEQIYESKLDLRHYMLQTTEHTIDVVFPSESIITIDGKEI